MLLSLFGLNERKTKNKQKMKTGKKLAARTSVRENARCDVPPRANGQHALLSDTSHLEPGSSPSFVALPLV